jgi:hypothetical protein
MADHELKDFVMARVTCQLDWRGQWILLHGPDSPRPRTYAAADHQIVKDHPDVWQPAVVSVEYDTD